MTSVAKTVRLKVAVLELRQCRHLSMPFPLSLPTSLTPVDLQDTRGQDRELRQCRYLWWLWGGCCFGGVAGRTITADGAAGKVRGGGGGMCQTPEGGGGGMCQTPGGGSHGGGAFDPNWVCSGAVKYP